MAQVNATQPHALDAHPQVREHFGQQLKSENPQAWREANSQLYEHYRRPEVSKEFPDTIEGMQPLYHAVAHACKAGRYQEALRGIYIARIQRGAQAFNTQKLGAFGAALAMLSGFFDSLWAEPTAELREADHGFLLNEAGFTLRAVGRLNDAVEPMRSGLERAEAIEDWPNASRASNNISDLYSTMGNLAGAFGYARRCVVLADESENAFQRIAARTRLGNTLRLLGKLDDADVALKEAEGIQQGRQLEQQILYSIQGFEYCELLLTQGAYAAVLTRATQALEWSTERGFLLDIAHDHLSLGRAHVIRVGTEANRDFSNAMEHLNWAVQGLRTAGYEDEMPLGLLARAELRNITGDYEVPVGTSTRR